MLPTLIVIFWVLGLIYLGLSTPTEAAMIGAASAALVSVYYRTFSLRMLKEAILGTMRTTGMIVFIMMGAGILSSAIAYA